MEERYYNKLAAAAVRGSLIRLGKAGEYNDLISKDLDELTKSDVERLFEAAIQTDVKLYNFKTSHRDLARVKFVLGFLHGIEFESLLDVGAGRGAFLIPFLAEFPQVKTEVIDILPDRVMMFEDMINGGLSNLGAMRADLCDKPFADSSVDVVTLLEVLEHIPNVEDAIKAAVQIARAYIVVTVPAKPDDNPEHIHLLTKEKLTEYFSRYTKGKLSFGYVGDSIYMIARVGG